jgi:hypothetical protein
LTKVEGHEVDGQTRGQDLDMNLIKCHKDV